MTPYNIYAEICYTAIVAGAGIWEYFKSKSKLSLAFGFYFTIMLSIGAYRQSFYPNRCSLFRTTSGFVAVISSMITIIIRMSIIFDSGFYKRHASKFKTFGFLSLLSIFKYNAATNGCRGTLFEIFFAMLIRFVEISQVIGIILTTQVNYINGFLNMIVIYITVLLITARVDIDLFDHRFIL